MKKWLTWITVLVMMLTLTVNIRGQQKFMVTVSGSMLFPADGGYKDVYGSSVFYPELKLAYKALNDFYVWAGYGLVSASGETVELKMAAKSSQHFISLGAGYNGSISPKLEYLVDLGAFYVGYKEEALAEEVDDSAVGFRADGSLIYRLGKNFFAGLTLGYLTASDNIMGIAVKLGGFQGGLVLGVKL